MMRKVWWVVVLIVLLLILLPPSVLASSLPQPASQDDEPDDGGGREPQPLCNPAAARLASWIGVECAVLETYIAQGVGLGEIARAFMLSRAFPELTWEEFLEWRMGGGEQEGVGWGEIQKAYWLGRMLGADPQELLTAHLSGQGWGEILQQYRQGPGKPSWAQQGPPPWAHGRGKPTGESNEDANNTEESGGLSEPQMPLSRGRESGRGQGHGQGRGHTRRK